VKDMNIQSDDFLALITRGEQLKVSGCNIHRPALTPTLATHSKQFLPHRSESRHTSGKIQRETSAITEGPSAPPCSSR
jgi:hypothetical protein